MEEDGLSGIATLLVNYENRLNELEHEVGVLQGRMPKSWKRRVLWFLNSGILIMVPIIGGAATIFGESPWKELIATAAFVFLVSRITAEFHKKVIQGPRVHQRIISKDYR